MKRRLLLSCACLLLPRVSAAAIDPHAARLLIDTEAASTSLAAQAAGRALVVVVMKGHWCAVCRAQLHRLAALDDQLQELGASVVGLNADSYKANREVAHRESMRYELLSDPDHRVISTLGLWLPKAGHPMPALVVFDRCGLERGRIVGRRPNQRPERELFALLRKMRNEKRPCDAPKA